MKRFLMAVAALGPALVAFSGSAHATYSVAAVDSGARQIGAAVTSCVQQHGDVSLDRIYGGVAGKGVVLVQGYLGGPGKAEARRLLGNDVPPSDIIAMITQATFDPGKETRQYGIVDLAGRAAGFTGSGADPLSDDSQGVAGSYTYAIQGDSMTSTGVVTRTEAAFVADGCDLADRLMKALEAGAAGGEGDSRCTGLSAPIPSDSAFLAVDREGETPGTYLRINLMNTRPQSPLPMLRAMFDAWRMTHPCPGVDAGATPDGPGGSDSAAGGDVPGGPDAAPDADSADRDARPPDLVVSDAGAPSEGGTDGKAGCACRAGHTPVSGAPWLLAFLLGSTRRRPTSSRV